MEEFVAKIQKPNRVAVPKEIMELEQVKDGDLVRVRLEKILRK